LQKCRGSRIKKKKSYRIRRSTSLSDHVVYLPESDVDIGHKDDPSLFSHAMSGEKLHIEIQCHEVRVKSIAQQSS